MDYYYSLIWFKKKGGSALKDVDTRYIYIVARTTLC